MQLILRSLPCLRLNMATEHPKCEHKFIEKLLIQRRGASVGEGLDEAFVDTASDEEVSTIRAPCRAP